MKTSVKNQSKQSGTVTGTYVYMPKAERHIHDAVLHLAHG